MPAPVGDPESGVYNPTKADFRAAIKSVAGASEEADAAAARANAAAAAAEAALDDTLGDLEFQKSRMANGAIVSIACFGDSTTDGNGTTDWTANPTSGGAAVGTSAHNPVNAWPSRLQQYLRRMHQNDNISVWNAGYGGRQIMDGWAQANYVRAVIDNPAYGTPNICLINFGLNDAVNPNWTVTGYTDAVNDLIDLIESYGTTAVIVTPDPVLQSTERSPHKLARVISVLRSVAMNRGLVVIESHDALERVISSGGLNTLWSFIQPDGLHFGNVGHRHKAGYVASQLHNGVFEMGQRSVAHISPASKFGCFKRNIAWSVFSEANNRFGCSINVTQGVYQPREDIMDMWVWCEDAETHAIWRAVSGEGHYSPLTNANGPILEVGRFLDASTTGRLSPAAGLPQQTQGVRESETPLYVGRLYPGLNRFTYRAPNTNENQIFLGYLTLSRRRNEKISTYYFPASGSGRVVVNDDTFEGDSLLIGTGFGAPSNMEFDCAMPDGTGVVLAAGRVFSDGTGGVTWRHRAIVLMRNGGNAQLLDVQYDATGVLAVGVYGSGAYAWDAKSNEFILRMNVSGGQWILQLTSLLAPLAPIVTINRPTTGAPLLLGGKIGGFYKDHDISPAAGRAKFVLQSVTFA